MALQRSFKGLGTRKGTRSRDTEPVFMSVTLRTGARPFVGVSGLAGACGDLDQAVLAAGVLAADLDDLEHPEQPVGIALVLGEQVPVLCALCRNDGHLSTLLLAVGTCVCFTTVDEQTVATRTISA